MRERRRRKTKIGGAFAPRLIEMIASPAFQVLSLSARRILDRLEIEFAAHGGRDNGRLACTYEHFVEFGIDRHSIAPAIRELVALGFVEITEVGRAGNADFRKPSRYRLTYRHTGDDPTEDWRRVRTKAEAKALARDGRRIKSERRKKNKKPMREIPIEVSGENPH